MGMAKLQLADAVEEAMHDAASTVAPSDKGLSRMVTFHTCPNAELWKRMHKEWNDAEDDYVWFCASCIQTREGLDIE